MDISYKFTGKDFPKLDVKIRTLKYNFFLKYFLYIVQNSDYDMRYNWTLI